MRIIIAGVALATSAVAALAAVALIVAAPAQAKPKHTWFYINYAHGKCEFSANSPEETYNLVSNGAVPGMTLDRITPHDVVKSDNGDIRVPMVGTKGGSAIAMNFFTSLRACEKFIADAGVKPQQADSGDIN
jgi:hypothetical protein